MATASLATKSNVDVEMPVPGSGRVVSAYLLVQVTLFVGLVWKISFFQLADEVYHRYPLLDSFFPEFFRSADVVRFAYLGAIGFIVVGVAGMVPWVRRLCAVATSACLAVILLHQAGYNDMTFATSLWVSVWLLWFTTRMDVDAPDDLLARGAFLSRCILTMILLGGAVGKWTPEYWSGEVFYDIYFLERDYWVFNYLRETYDAEALRNIAMWYSRKVVVVETVFGFILWLLPPKWAAASGVIIFFSIAMLSNFLLFSVLTCLIGLSAVGFFVRQPGRVRNG